MKQISKKAMAATALALAALPVLGLTSSRWFNDTANASPTATPPTIQAQIAADVRKAIQINEESRNYEEWSTSGYTPSDLFRNAKDLAQRSPEAIPALCQALSKLRTEDLALFQAEIDRIENRKVFDCLKALGDAVEDFWTESRDEAEQTLQKLRNGEDDLLEFSAEETKPIKKLESIEKPIDPRLGQTFFRADLGPKEVALTFDDGPHPSRTQKILDTLAENEVRATFFELGANVKQYPDITRAVEAGGHTVGSHTVNHPLMTALARKSMKAAEEEILSGRSIVEGILGHEAPFFRFPYGASNQALRNFAKEQKMAMFHWAIDTSDWKYRNPKVLFKNIVTELAKEKNGIMLFHDIQEQTTIVLPLVLETLKAKGYSTVLFVPASR